MRESSALAIGPASSPRRAAGLARPAASRAGLDELREAVAVAERQGAEAFQARLAAASLARLAPAADPPAPTLAAPAAAAGLSPRERELLGLRRAGLTDKEIAS